MEFLKPTRGLAWSPAVPRPVALDCLQPSRSLHEKLCKSGGAGRAQRCTGPARSSQGGRPAAPAEPARSSRSPAVPAARRGLAGAAGPARRRHSREVGRQGVPASLLAVLSALGNAELMFLGFFSLPHLVFTFLRSG